MSSQDFEQCVIATALLDGGHTDLPLQTKHFTQSVLADIWQDIHDESDVNTLKLAQKHGEQTLCDIIDNVPTSMRSATSVRQMCSSIIKAYDVRKFIAQLDLVKVMVESGVPIGEAMLKLQEADTGSVDKEPVALLDLMREVYQEIEDVSNGTKELNTYIPTGLTDFDKTFGGIERSAYTVVAGRPSMGKTAFAMQVCLNAAKAGQKVLVISLEMSAKSIAYRILSSASKVDLQILRRAKIKSQEAWRKLATGMNQVHNSSLHVDDQGGLTLAQLMAKIRRHHRKHGMDLLMIDYLGLMTSDNKSQKKFEYISEISNAMPTLAKELGIGLVALSQLGRDVEKRPDKHPMMSDLRDSGSIEQDADNIIMLYREEYYQRKPENEGLAEVIMQKQRNGATGTIKMHFDKETASFKDLERKF
ncbi:MAG: DnaB-like helicase C-terminal domain-containing protein [Mariprofundaceae bacterium]|nr:DnaB-like helicase C-terminal domain-containing protein [Mariprofundaceae bacterium]